MTQAKNTFQKKALAIIPARGGSKGIPNKNVRLLAGEPLVVYTIEAALEVALLDRTIVSTDAERIAEVSKQAGAEVPFIRPAELGRDDTPTLAVVQHALEWLKQREDYEPEFVILLQPTSPLRTAKHIDEAIKLLLRTNADSVVSVCEAEHSPYWMKKIGEEGRVSPLIKTEKDYNRRQDLPRVYRLNGAIFITRPKIIMEEDRILGDDTRAYVMSQEDSIDIDTELDFKLAELVIKDRISNIRESYDQESYNS